MDNRQQLEEEGEKTGARAVETFRRLWVVDVCRTDWQLAAFPSLETEVQEQVATGIREIHIIKGRIWRSNLAWRRLPNLGKLRVVEPTSSWETGKGDEFMNMVKLDLLDLSGNSTMQFLPSLSGATGLKTLVLDGCFGLEHVGPQGLPPSLESFCLDAGAGGGYHGNKATSRISRIILAGCARLSEFRLRGSLPMLEELDLSRTAVKMLDLRGSVVQLENLERLLLMGCKQLRSIPRPHTRMQRLRLLCIDTRSGGEVVRKQSPFDDSLVSQGEDCCYAYVAIEDMRFLQSLEFIFLVTTARLKMDLHLSTSSSKDDGANCYKAAGKMGRQPCGKPPPAYRDVIDNIEQQRQQQQIETATRFQFQPLDVHVEIGEGIKDVVTDAVSAEGKRAIRFVINRIKSLHAHGTCSITSLPPQNLFMLVEDDRYGGAMNQLKSCLVEGCPKLDTVFATNYEGDTLRSLETIWAAHLLMVRSIWSRPTRTTPGDLTQVSSVGLRAIHLHLCPRLRYVLALSSSLTFFHNLETLHILGCGDLRQVFPVEQEFLSQMPHMHEADVLKAVVVEFSHLKDLYLHDLPSLQMISEAGVFAPRLERIYIRGCWSLKRLPVTHYPHYHYQRSSLLVAVDCEKDLWDKLEWDGREYGHHPSSFQPRHSKYYKKRHLRGTVLR
ncbi:unnamed protein product [Urochloa humidicola]